MKLFSIFSISLLNGACVFSYCCCSVAQSCLTLGDPMGSTLPGLPVLHHLSELSQTHVHWVSDAINPSCPLSSPSPPAFNLSQHQESFPVSWHFASGGQSIEVSASESVLLMNIQDWFPLELTDLISLQPKLLSRVFFNTTVEKHQFGAQPSLWSSSHIHTWYWKNYSFDYMALCQQSNATAF